MPQWIRLETPAEGVAVVTLTQPETRNQGSWDAISQLADALVQARESGARVSVLASGLAGHWIEHAWLRDLRATMLGEATTGDGVCWFRALQEITSPELLSVAAIAGDCSGGGAELAWACDLRVAEESACFSQPEVLMRLSTGIGGTARLARLVGRTAAAEMVFDGGPIGARRMYELGALNRVVPAGEAVDAAIDWARRLATRSPAAVAACKRILQAGDDLPLGEALAREQQLFQERAHAEDALHAMERLQARFDAGETTRAVYGELAAARSPLRGAASR